MIAAFGAALRLLRSIESSSQAGRTQRSFCRRIQACASVLLEFNVGGEESKTGGGLRMKGADGPAG